MPEDEQDQKQPDSPDSPDSPASPDSPEAPAGTGDDLRDKFRAALDRKHGRGPDGAAGSGATGGDPTGKASARTSNSKRQREFRRKSGG